MHNSLVWLATPLHITLAQLSGLLAKAFNPIKACYASRQAEDQPRTIVFPGSIHSHIFTLKFVNFSS